MKLDGESWAGFAIIVLLGLWSLAAVVTAAASVYGLVLAFLASTLLGVLMLLLPAVLVLGMAGLLGHVELAHNIAKLLGLVK